MAIATPTPWTAGTHFSTYQIDSLLATGRYGRGVAGQDEGLRGLREAGGDQDDGDASVASPRAGADVHRRGVAGGAPVAPQHRRRLRLRRAGGAVLHRHGVRPGADAAGRPQAHDHARRTAADRRGVARHARRLRGAAAHPRAGGRQRAARPRAPRPLPRQRHPVDQRHDQSHRLRRRPRHGAHAARPTVRRALSLCGSRAHQARGGRPAQRPVFSRRDAVRMPDRRASVRRHRRGGDQGGHREPCV